MDDTDGLRTPMIGEVPDTIVELGMTAFTYYNNPSTVQPSSWNYRSNDWCTTAVL